MALPAEGVASCFGEIKNGKTKCSWEGLNWTLPLNMTWTAIICVQCLIMSLYHNFQAAVFFCCRLLKIYSTFVFCESIHLIESKYNIHPLHGWDYILRMLEMSLKSYLKSVTFQRNDFFGKLSHRSFSSAFVRPRDKVVKCKVIYIIS